MTPSFAFSEIDKTPRQMMTGETSSVSSTFVMGEGMQDYQGSC